MNTKYKTTFWICLLIVLGVNVAFAAIALDPMLKKTKTVKDLEKKESANYVNEAKEYINKRDLKQAISLLRKAIYIDEENPDAYFLLGKVYFMLGNKNYGKGLMEKAVELPLASEDIFKALIRVYIDNRQYKKALAAMNKMQNKFNAEDIREWIERQVRIILNSTSGTLPNDPLILSLFKQIINTELIDIRNLLDEVLEIADRNEDYEKDKSDIDAKIKILERNMDILENSVKTVLNRGIKLPHMGEILSLIKKIRDNIFYIKDGYVLTGAEIVGDLVADLNKCFVE